MFDQLDYDGNGYLDLEVLGPTLEKERVEMNDVTLHHSAEKHGEMVTCAYNKAAKQCTCKCMMRSAPAAAVQTAV